MNDENAQTHQGYKETELGILPETWKVIRFGDKGVFQYGYTTSATNKDTGTKFLRITDIRNDGSIDWNSVPYGDITADDLQKFKLREGDLLFARIGATTGKTCIMRRKLPNSIFASYLIRCVPNEEVYPFYMFYFTQTRQYWKLVNAGKEGKLKKGLSASELKEFLCPLPPLPEQKTIAYVLQVIQEAKEKSEAVIRATKELKKSMMKHLFTYGPVAPEKAEKVRLKETEIGVMPEEWEVAKLGEVVDIVYGVQAAVAHLTDSSIGIPILTNINITNEGALDTSTLRYYSLPEKKRERLKLRKGDVLFNWRSGSQRHVGKTALFDLDGDFTFSSFILRFRPREKLGSTFLHHFLNYLKVQGYFSKNRDQSSVNSVFNASLSAKIPIYVPPSIVQDKISEVLFSIDAKIEAEENKKNALEGLFKTLLHDLMTAKIRVNNLPLEA